MKKSAVMIIPLICALALSACGNEAPQNTEAAVTPETSVSEPAAETVEAAESKIEETAAADDTAAETTVPAEETAVTEETVKKKKHEIRIEQDIESLSDYFAGDFKVGTALVPNDLLSRNVMALTQKHFGDSLTAGNEMKPDYVLDKPATLTYFQETGDDENPQVSFTQAQRLLDYCNENNVPMRVHTLVWHGQTPTWFFKEGYDDKGEWVSAEKMTRRLENYIKNYFTVLTELYPDIDFYACDVVNEAWLEDGKCRKPGQRETAGDLSPWVQVYGDNSFIEHAFTFARKYAPEGCKLYYNDYNEYMDGKLNAIYTMAKDFKEKGIIDGIGMQSHLDVRKGSDAFPSVEMYNKALDKYSELGLDIQVTELDATVPADSGDTYFAAQSNYYKGILSSIYAHKDNISAVILWGVTDDRSWRKDQQPLLFNKEFLAKPAFYSILEVKSESDNSAE